LYTRWEYVNRDAVSFHHLQTMRLDGKKTDIFFGNEKPGGVFIDARAVPQSDKIVFVWSGWHGQNEHAGDVVILDPRFGPNDYSGLRWFTPPKDGYGQYRDPCPLSEYMMILANGQSLVLRDASGNENQIVQGTRMLHEPVLVRKRLHEPLVHPAAGTADDALSGIAALWRSIDGAGKIDGSALDRHRCGVCRDLRRIRNGADRRYMEEQRTDSGTFRSLDDNARLY
jgi:hypothetical protein